MSTANANGDPTLPPGEPPRPQMGLNDPSVSLYVPRVSLRGPRRRSLYGSTHYKSLQYSTVPRRLICSFEVEKNKKTKSSFFNLQVLLVLKENNVLIVRFDFDAFIFCSEIVINVLAKKFCGIKTH